MEIWIWVLATARVSHIWGPREYNSPGFAGREKQQSQDATRDLNRVAMQHA